MDANTTVLVVDDEVLLRNMIRTLLSQEGYEVLVAADGNEAVEVARAHRGSIDLLLTDVEMPRLDGISAFQRISCERPTMKVLFMSGASTQSARLEQWPFLGKPFHLDVLLTIVSDILRNLPAVGKELAVILVVDQDEDRKKRTRSILVDNGYAVLTASSAKEAELVSASQKKIDLIISEVMLSGDSGVQVAEDASDRNIHTLLISHFHPDLLNKVPGFSTQEAFLANPFTAADLLARVSQLLKASSKRATF